MREATDGLLDRAPPRVTVHFAQSLDGRIATKTGASRWISGPETMRFAHALRAFADVVLVGSGTAITDDPKLTVRLVEGKQPLRVVLDARGRLHETAALYRDTTARTLHVTRRPIDGPLPSHVERCELPAGARGEGVDLRALLRHLEARGARELLVEGGRGVITSFLREGLVDRILITVAPLFIGSGIDAIGDLGVSELEDALRFDLRRVVPVGGDVLLELSRKDVPPLPLPLAAPSPS